MKNRLSKRKPSTLTFLLTAKNKTWNLVASALLTFAGLNVTTCFAGQNDINAIEEAFYNNNVTRLVELKRATAGYDQFLASYRLGLQYNANDNIKNAKIEMSDLISRMENYTKEHPQDSDALALLANIYGYTISLDPALAKGYGPRSHSALAKAIKLAPNNPRVLLTQGIIHYNTPTMYGGDKAKAQSSLAQALLLFQSDLQSGRHWGVTEANIWMGMTYLETGDIQQARHYWQQALTANPSSDWAAFLLSKHTLAESS